MAKAATNKSASKPPSKLPAADWRVAILEQVRTWIREADSEMVEEQKWKKASQPEGVPVWSHGGIVCTGETYKQVVKLTFAKGAALADPKRLFNASLDGNTRRAIDLREGETLDAAAFKALIRAAVDANLSTKPARPKVSPKSRDNRTQDRVKLLSGGNPQIAKGFGDEPVQAYIAAMPGWKSELGRRLDALITKTVPHVRKAVKWNSPLYGVEDHHYFLGIHVFAKYVKVAFFRGVALRPLPPDPSKQEDVRYLNLYEDTPLDEAQFCSWVKQASKLPGQRM